jgi:G:T/U-mismatch repair DNA glycosylase
MLMEFEQVIKMRDLTKLEKDIQRQKLQKQKDNITHPQIVMGREFKGQAFTMNPPKVLFKDFTVNEPHVQTVVFTNSSQTLSTF